MTLTIAHLVYAGIAMATAGFAMAAAMVGYALRNERWRGEVASTLDHHTQMLNAITERLDRLTERMDRVTEKLDRTIDRLDRTIERLDEAVERLDRVSERLDEATGKVNEVVHVLRSDKFAVDIKPIPHKVRDTDDE